MLRRHRSGCVHGLRLPGVLFWICGPLSGLAAAAGPAQEWLPAANQSCDTVCQAAGRGALETGMRRNEHPYYVCRADAHGEGKRAGNNVRPNWAQGCWVAWGGQEMPVTPYECLCIGKAPPPNRPVPRENLKLPTAWTQREGRVVRLNAQGEVECLAANGADCDYRKSIDDPQPGSGTPATLACGEDYKAKHGITGYDDPRHWCSRALRQMRPQDARAGMSILPVGEWRLGSLLVDREGRPMADMDVYLGLTAEGDVQCLSWNAHDCAWGDTGEIRNRQAIRPLVCGAMHLREWGIAGYDNPRHWCARVRAALTM
ncbi:MAG: hypothetical protein HYZ17_11605 [Betaproteobacteria bacterium]|nr:hypothetical protein [Betaproteobacteria bacterium]